MRPQGSMRPCPCAHPHCSLWHGRALAAAPRLHETPPELLREGWSPAITERGHHHFAPAALRLFAGKGSSRKVTAPRGWQHPHGGVDKTSSNHARALLSSCLLPSIGRTHVVHQQCRMSVAVPKPHGWGTALQCPLLFMARGLWQGAISSAGMHQSCAKPSSCWEKGRHISTAE